MAVESSTGNEKNEAYQHMSIGKAQSLGTEKVNEIIKSFNLDNLGKIDSNGNEAEAYVNNTITSSSDLIDKFGIRQDVVIVGSNDDVLLKAQRTLNDNCLPKEDLQCEVIGDLTYRIGWGVHVVFDWLPTGYKDCFMYIKEFKHTWKAKGQFVTQLTLTPSRVMDTKEWTDTDTSSDKNSSNSGSSASVEKAVTWAIRIANDNTHGYSMANRDGNPDYDCSSFVISAFEQAGILLKTNGATNTKDMKSVCLSTGFEEVSWGNSVNALKRGDILLNEEHHVALYIGDGKLVHASSDRGHPEAGDQDGTEIYVANYYSRPWDCVLRYKISENTGSSTGLASSQLIDFIKGWEGFEPTPKDDGYGNISIGFGMTGSEIGGRTSITEGEATQWLQEHVNSDYAKPLKERMDNMGITTTLQQNQFDVLVDMAYNIGVEGFDSLLNMLKGGASEEPILLKLTTFNHVNGAVSDGLTKRCEARVKMWKDGVYDSSH